MASAWKLVYGPWVSTVKTYIDYGSTDHRQRNYNGNLVCEVGTEITTNDFTTVIIGTDPPADIPIGFEAHASLQRFAQMVLHPGLHPWIDTVSRRPSLVELGCHAVVLDYDPDVDVDTRYGDHLLLLRADVVDELTIDDLETAAGFALSTTDRIDWTDPVTHLPTPGEFYGRGGVAP